MKFVCDRCQTRYSISDEKVKGKVLKIRCKTCGNIIVVREQGAESATVVSASGGANAPRTEVEMPRQAAVGGSAVRSPVAASGDHVEWFVAIKGKQHGPMKKPQLLELFRHGRIHPRSYCWHEELAGWTRMKDLPEFASIIAQGQNTAPAAKPPPPPPEEENGAEVVDLQKHRQQRQHDDASTAPAAEPGALGAGFDPFAAVDQQAAAQSSAPLDSSAPRESTRVFIMNAGLHNRSKKHKTYAAVASTVFIGLVSLMTLDYMGIVKIPFLGDAALAIADYAGVEGAAEKKRKRKLLAKWEDGELDPDAACKFLGDCPQAAVKKRRARRRGQGAGDDGFTDDMFQTGGPGESGAIGRGDVGPDGQLIDLNAGGGAASAALRKKFANDDRGFIGVKDKMGKRDSIALASSGGPDPANMQKVVSNGMGGIKTCIERAAKQGSSATGKQKLLLVIKNNGRVQQARILHGPTNASPLGECIRKAARKWKFPPFGGDTFELVVPLVLTAN